MNRVIRRLKEIMYDPKEQAPIAKPKVQKAKKAVEEVKETEVQKLERELEELKKAEVKSEEIIEEKVEEPNQHTTDDILLNHEQRIMQMEAKWFRLGGI